MSTWTDELKQSVIDRYAEMEPTAETSAEIVKEIAEEFDVSPNGVRQVLIQAGVYVKKEAPTTGGKSTGKSSGEGTKRVSKEAQYDALRAAIKAAGKDVDEDIITKLTGKAAAYFVSVLSK